MTQLTQFSRAKRGVVQHNNSGEKICREAINSNSYPHVRNSISAAAGINCTYLYMGTNTVQDISRFVIIPGKWKPNLITYSEDLSRKINILCYYFIREQYLHLSFLLYIQGKRKNFLEFHRCKVRDLHMYDP